jgi:hypothetical protein
MSENEPVTGTFLGFVASRRRFALCFRRFPQISATLQEFPDPQRDTNRCFLTISVA